MEYNKVIQGNSDIILKQFLDEGVKFDLICTDPPYNLNKDFGNDSDRLGLDEFLKVTEQRIDLCKELLTPNGSIVWFGIHHYIGFIILNMQIVQCITLEKCFLMQVFQ